MRLNHFRKLVLSVIMLLLLSQTKDVVLNYLSYPTNQQIHWFTPTKYLLPSITFEVDAEHQIDFLSESYLKLDNSIEERPFNLENELMIEKNVTKGTILLSFFNKLANSETREIGEGDDFWWTQEYKGNSFELHMLLTTSFARKMSFASATDSPFDSQISYRAENSDVRLSKQQFILQEAPYDTECYNYTFGKRYRSRFHCQLVCNQQLFNGSNFLDFSPSAHKIQFFNKIDFNLSWIRMDFEPEIRYRKSAFWSRRDYRRCLDRCRPDCINEMILIPKVESGQTKKTFYDLYFNNDSNDKVENDFNDSNEKTEKKSFFDFENLIDENAIKRMSSVCLEVDSFVSHQPGYLLETAVADFGGLMAICFGFSVADAFRFLFGKRQYFILRQACLLLCYSACFYQLSLTLKDYFSFDTKIDIDVGNDVEKIIPNFYFVRPGVPGLTESVRNVPLESVKCVPVYRNQSRESLTKFHFVQMSFETLTYHFDRREVRSIRCEIERKVGFAFNFQVALARNNYLPLNVDPFSFTNGDVEVLVKQEMVEQLKAPYKPYCVDYNDATYRFPNQDISDLLRCKADCINEAFFRHHYFTLFTNTTSFTSPEKNEAQNEVFNQTSSSNYTDLSFDYDLFNDTDLFYDYDNFKGSDSESLVYSRTKKSNLTKCLARCKPGCQIFKYQFRSNQLRKFDMIKYVTRIENLTNEFYENSPIKSSKNDALPISEKSRKVWQNNSSISDRIYQAALGLAFDDYILRVTVKFDDFPVVRYRFVPVMSFNDLVYNFGGLVGLWFGCSVIALLNMIYSLPKVKLSCFR